LAEAFLKNLSFYEVKINKKQILEKGFLSFFLKKFQFFFLCLGFFFVGSASDNTKLLF